MPFPTTKRYFLRFRHEDTGLTPVFTYFNNASSFSPISPPAINEVNGVGTGNGSYYFDYTYTTETDPSVVFEVDGGASIPTEEIRYIGDNISPSDAFLDQAVSDVAGEISAATIAAAVWDTITSAHTVSGSFGLLIGSTIAGQMQRALGMLHENSVLDLTSFDSNNNLLSARLRTYSTQADAIAAEAASPGPYTTNMIAQYAITATYIGSNLQTYLVDRTV